MTGYWPNKCGAIPSVGPIHYSPPSKEALGSTMLPDGGQRNCRKHVEFYSKNKLEKLVHLVGFIIRVYHDARSCEYQRLFFLEDGVKCLFRNIVSYRTTSCHVPKSSNIQ